MGMSDTSPETGLYTVEESTPEEIEALASQHPDDVHDETEIDDPETSEAVTTDG